MIKIWNRLRKNGERRRRQQHLLNWLHRRRELRRFKIITWPPSCLSRWVCSNNQKKHHICLSCFTLLDIRLQHSDPFMQNMDAYYGHVQYFWPIFLTISDPNSPNMTSIYTPHVIFDILESSAFQKYSICWVSEYVNFCFLSMLFMQICGYIMHMAFAHNFFGACSSLVNMFCL